MCFIAFLHQNEALIWYVMSLACKFMYDFGFLTATCILLMCSCVKFDEITRWFSIRSSSVLAWSSTILFLIDWVLGSIDGSRRGFYLMITSLNDDCLRESWVVLLNHCLCEYEFIELVNDQFDGFDSIDSITWTLLLTVSETHCIKGHWFSLNSWYETCFGLTMRNPRRWALLPRGA